ncbi:MAG: AAA domain-containing protein [Verrucomicrobiales bacterium]
MLDDTHRGGWNGSNFTSGENENAVAVGGRNVDRHGRRDDPRFCCGMILEAMLQRLFASLVNGPSMNARPHRSRQRCDWMDLAAFDGADPTQALAPLIESGRHEFPARVPAFAAPAYPEAEWSVEEKQARDAHQRQVKLLKKLRDIADDALEYLNDHGESCLAIGFPLVSMPSSSDEGLARGSSRLLAPMLLMPVHLQVRTGSRAGVTLECAAEGADRLVANPALVAYLERQTGKSLGEVFPDEGALDPWREVKEVLDQMARLLDLPAAPEFLPATPLAPVPTTDQLPKSAAVLPSAVLGLFPLSNQSLLRDTRWMIEHEKELREPVSAFLNPRALHDQGTAEDPPAAGVATRRDFSHEWLVANADPCQTNAVLASREAKALVVHGPPGTGKSQTITNMIADHLARGERILFVCDKRTALDVVKYRLDAVGLGDLCGVVHDPSSDRRDFYMGLRAQLENLAEAPPIMDPRPRLEEVNNQLASIHRELEGCRQKLHATGEPGGTTFHALLGTWLQLAYRQDLPPTPPLPDLRSIDIEHASTTIGEICRRAEKAGYSTNPFRGWVGVTLHDFLTHTDPQLTLQAIHAAAEAVPAMTLTSRVDPGQPLAAQAAHRETVTGHLRSLLKQHDEEFLRAVTRLPAPRRGELAADLDPMRPWLNHIEDQPIDRALLASARAAGVLPLATVNQHLAALTAWEPIAGSFFKKLFAGSPKKAVTTALVPLGLSLDSGWPQGLAFYKALQTRLLIADWLSRAVESRAAALPDDATLVSQTRLVDTAWHAQAGLAAIDHDELPAEKSALDSLASALETEATVLRRLDDVVSRITQCRLFTPDAGSRWLVDWLARSSASQTTRAWLESAPTLEDMIRLRHSLGLLPPDVASATESLLATATAPDSETLLDCLRRQAVENELRARLKNDPDLAAIDGDRIEAAFDRFLHLSQFKLSLVADYVRFLWLTHQKSRLLATTGTQLNKLGSGLRQRLYVRGKKALKLRQMLATGSGTEGGDPIYDLCPVWMASPSTVAQIFPRHAIFNLVIFDEASQCRLEEALPVLMRGERVVIAGDQKQLPPTRFFESALADTGDADAETAEELFFQQQSEAEDLLTAALNLDVREAYLDVHYRSRHEALIGFSNDHYYGSRLQPIPGHPRHKALDTPIRIHRVNGTYHERANVKEAEAAIDLIAELLDSPAPPSIGVACFNVTQKEAIHDALTARLARDAEFARRYEEAKIRKGRDSFEGLFVKNLENVQGDERDIMIICTTFGPDHHGKFRRNFGALSQREGGRRLNVLVTRAREAVHVLTSIPAAEYATAEPAPPGQIPNGRLQLYAYLRYAEKLAGLFHNYQEELEKMRRDAAPELKSWPSATPSPMAAALAHTLLNRHHTGSHLHWGNDGFCIDVACIHPLLPADVTVGVLTDFSRFHKTPDPIEWDIFRTRVLRSQGWELQRLWSPVVFRRATEMLARIKSAHDRLSTLNVPIETT